MGGSRSFGDGLEGLIVAGCIRNGVVSRGGKGKVGGASRFFGQDKEAFDNERDGHYDEEEAPEFGLEPGGLLLVKEGNGCLAKEGFSAIGFEDGRVVLGVGAVDGEELGSGTIEASVEERGV